MAAVTEVVTVSPAAQRRISSEGRRRCAGQLIANRLFILIDAVSERQRISGSGWTSQLEVRCPLTRQLGLVQVFDLQEPG